MNNRWNHFDGLRLWAILVIIASHTNALWMYGQGSIIVCLFYVLSGFFCVMPMVDGGEEKFASIGGWGRFYLLRLVRIIPVYWLIVIFFYWVSNTAIADKTALINNLFFINTYGHLWYLQHEVVCYLVTPVIMLVIYLIKKKVRAKNWMIGTGLVVLGLLLSKYLFSTVNFCLLWNGEKRQLRLGLFVIGMGVGYLIKQLKDLEIKNKLLIFGLDLMEIVLMLTVTVFTSAAFLSKFNPEYADYYIGWHKPILCTLLCAVLVFVLAVNKGGLVARILGLPIMVRLGSATFGVYLLHFFLIEFLQVPPLKQFALVAVISICVALVLYELVEKPMYARIKNFTTKRRSK